MPFSLRNTAQTFQRFMDRLFKHLPFVFCYLDDLIIASRTLEEHHEHLQQIFTILQENGLQINPAKCVFAAAVEFLGHRVDQHGARPLQRHVQAISEFPSPQDVKQLQQFLGMVNFYRRFLPGIARMLQPLTDALRGDPRRWSGCPPPLSRRPRLRWQPLYRWRIPLRTPYFPLQRMPQTNVWEPCYNSWLEGAGSRRRSTPRSCQGRAPDTPPSAGSCWPHSARSGTSDSYWKGEDFACSRTTNHWSHPCSAPAALVGPSTAATILHCRVTSDIRHTPGQENMVADALSRPPPAAAKEPQTAQQPPTAQPTSSAPTARTGRRRVWLHQSGQF
jgi:hypothetical protein